MRAALRGVLAVAGVLGLVLALALGPAGPATAGDGDYHIGPGDLLRINVIGNPDLGLETRVSEGGNISYPFVGQIPLAGMSSAQAEALIAKRLKDANIVKQPQVALLVTEYQSQKVAVMGQVSKPGQYPLERASRVIDALAQAGGTLDALAADQATLLRKDGSSTKVDLTALFNGDAAQNLQVQGGDTLFVPKAPQFYIQGEVQRPGVYKLERGMTVSQAISAGGGLTRRGSNGRVAVQRHDAKGGEVTVSLKATDRIAADDVLIVKESLF